MCSVFNVLFVFLKIILNEPEASDSFETPAVLENTLVKFTNFIVQCNKYISVGFRFVIKTLFLDSAQNFDTFVQS